MSSASFMKIVALETKNWRLYKIFKMSKIAKISIIAKIAEVSAPHKGGKILLKFAVLLEKYRK